MTQSFPTLPCGTILFRAVLYHNHIKKGKIKWQAFKRREADSDGLSTGLTEAAALSELQDVAGVVTLHVGYIRDIVDGEVRLDVIQDEELHALIIGLPYLHDIADSNERNRQEDIEQRLCKQIRDKAARLLKELPV